MLPVRKVENHLSPSLTKLFPGGILMTRLRKIALLTLAIVTCMVMADSATAVANEAADALRDRMKLHDKTFSTPPTMSLDQRRLQIAVLSAFETQVTDLGLIMDAYSSAAVFGTFYLHAETTFSWSGDEWLVGYRTLYYYTSNNLTESTEQDWNGSEWENRGRTLATWDGSDRLATSTFQMWNVDSNAFVNNIKFTYTYSGPLLTQVLFQNWNGTMWVDANRNTATYSGNLVTEQLTESWNAVHVRWPKSCGNQDPIVEWIYLDRYFQNNQHVLGSQPNSGNLCPLDGRYRMGQSIPGRLQLRRLESRDPCSRLQLGIQ